MSRLARVVIPGLPHLVTQRGNRGETVFFSDDDYDLYLELLREWTARAQTRVWAWCLLPTHLHLILVPSHEDGLRQTMASMSRRYASHINRRQGWSGHLWHDRYGSVVMDEPHLLHAFRYVLLSPVHLGLVERAGDWRWSSLHACLSGDEDGLTESEALRQRVDDIRAFLDDPSKEGFEPLVHSETTGRPVGGNEFLDNLERRLRRPLRPRSPGRKRGPIRARR
jgi:putative transposase